MIIQVLPPRLANQIAAGEVVERPSSVVKELIENSIDAGATRIDIDIEKGGAKLIRIRDNGCGVEKEQLGLALSRHATSKLATLDDLEAIDSLGFRGEALASISSVSRLTFTSRTKLQQEAWQAYAEGRDMQVQVKPAAHPVGTTVEVSDLFFNTPARRKFLRTDKTEFNHIDELVRRFALSRFDLQFSLKNNGKVIRSYRPAASIEQQERRVASVTSTHFMAHCIALNCEHSDIKLWGWVGLPHEHSPQDVQYSYVNGRMMRDKLINHALRQAYEEATGVSAAPAYVLFIEVSVREVDVNVHPAKHEVRFHQARLVHDFIFQAVFKAVMQGLDGALLANKSTDESTEGLLPAVAEITYPGQVNSLVRTAQQKEQHQYGSLAVTAKSDTTAGNVVSQGISEGYEGLGYGGQSYAGPNMAHRPAANELKQYTKLLQPGKTEAGSSHVTQSPGKAKLLTVVADKYLLLQDADALLLLDLLSCWRLNCKMQLLSGWQENIVSQPLLLPIAIKLDKNFVEIAKNQQVLLNKLGLELNYSNAATIIVRKVPALLRQANLPVILPELLQQLVHLSAQSSTTEVTALCHWLATQGSHGLTAFTWEQATQIYSQFMMHAASVQSQYNATLFEQIDYMSIIERFNCDSTAEK
ncbi:MAG: DNA mismatch repair protein MutL [Moritella sp.]|jgi:DNA mismatch repair protein MutL